MRVAVVQHDPAWEDAAATVAALDPVVADAVTGDVDLVVLPETFATGFSMATARTAEPEDGPTVTWMRQQAVRHGVWVLGSVLERRADDPRPRNCCHVVDPSGATVVRYDKQRRFAYAGEDEHVAPAALPRDGRLPTVDVAGCRVTPLVCYDLRFADLPWAVADRTDCYVVIASWPAARREHWRTLLRARAIENQAWVLGANRVGEDGNGMAHAGDSVVVDPLGRVHAEAAHTPTVLHATVEPDEVDRVRTMLPFMQDRRGAWPTGPA